MILMRPMKKFRIHGGVALLLLSLPLLCVAQTPARPSSATHAAPANAAGADAAPPEQRAKQVYFQTLAAFLLDHDRTKAEHGFLQATRIDAACAPAWFNLGVFAEADKNWVAAERDFHRYLLVAPAGPDARRAKAQLRILSKYSTGAVTPEDARRAEYDAAIQRARAFLSAGLFREAITEAGRAEAQDKSRWEAYAVVALAMAKQNKHDEAVKFEALAAEHAPPEKRQQVQAALATKIAAWTR